MSAVKGAVVDGDLAAEIGRWAATGAVVYGIASGAHVFAVGALPIPEGPSSTAAWVNAFIDQVRPILPGGIEPVGVLSNATRDGADVDLTFSTDERGALRCLRRSASSTVAVPVKTQPGLASSLHCLTGVIDIGSHDLPFPSTREVAAQRLSESISAYMAKALFLIDGKQVAADDSSSVSSLGNKDGEHSVEFLVSTLMSTPVSPPRVRFSGSQHVLAYVLPTATITEAVRAVVDDVTRSSLHRLRVFSEDSPTEWSWAPDDASEGRKPAVFHLPRRLPFPVGHVRLSDYAFPGESVDEVNERVDEFTGRSNAFESFGAVVEEFPTIDELRPPVPQAIVRSTPAAKPSFLDLRLLFVLVVPIVIALLVAGTWRLH